MNVYIGGKPMKSFMASPSTIERKWYVVDATGYTLGRLASEVAKVLRGKNKPIFTMKHSYEKLFKISALSQTEKRFLMYLCLMPLSLWTTW